LASENLQKKMSNILDGLAGVLCLMDDLLTCIFGRNKMIDWLQPKNESKQQYNTKQGQM